MSSAGQTTAVGPLPVTMIEASGGTALMTLACRTPLLRARLRTTRQAAIALPAITSTTQKETRATMLGAAKALPERLQRAVSAHRSRSLL